MGSSGVYRSPIFLSQALCRLSHFSVEIDSLPVSQAPVACSVSLPCSHLGLLRKTSFLFFEDASAPSPSLKEECLSSLEPTWNHCPANLNDPMPEKFMRTLLSFRNGIPRIASYLSRLTMSKYHFWQISPNLISAQAPNWIVVCNPEVAICSLTGFLSWNISNFDIAA